MFQLDIVICFDVDNVTHIGHKIKITRSIIQSVEPEHLHNIIMQPNQIASQAPGFSGLNWGGSTDKIPHWQWNIYNCLLVNLLCSMKKDCMR